MFGNIARRLQLLVFVVLISQSLPAQVPSPFSESNNYFAEVATDSVVTILLAADGQSQAVGSGLVAHSDGYILTAYHLVKESRDVQIRLRNGEIFDKAEIVSTDERRNIALLKINASGLRAIPTGTFEEAQVGGRIFIVANPNGQSLISKDSLLNSVQMADSIPGAGAGYRLLQFNTAVGENTVGGLILDDRGRSLGIITTQPSIKNQNIAVPLSSVLGLIRSATVNNQGQTTSYTPPPKPNTPYPIPQSTVQMPERGVVPLSPKGPGSVVIKPRTPKEALNASKTVYITSRTTFFKPDQLVNALMKRKEIDEWSLSFVDEREVADLILELDHVFFTYKFTFKLYSQRLGVVVATGDVIIWDGNLGASKMASRVIEKMSAIREPKPNTSKDKKPGTN